jgi:hypothetical protein
MTEEAAPTAEFIQEEDHDSTEPSLTDRIRERPLVALGLAGATGFVLGGGAFSRTGMAILMIFGRLWLRQAVTDVIASAMANHQQQQRERNGHAWTR